MDITRDETRAHAVALTSGTCVRMVGRQEAFGERGGGADPRQNDSASRNDDASAALPGLSVVSLNGRSDDRQMFTDGKRMTCEIVPLQEWAQIVRRDGVQPVLGLRLRRRAAAIDPTRPFRALSAAAFVVDDDPELPRPADIGVRVADGRLRPPSFPVDRCSAVPDPPQGRRREGGAMRVRDRARRGSGLRSELAEGARRFAAAYDAVWLLGWGRSRCSTCTRCSGGPGFMRVGDPVVLRWCCCTAPERRRPSGSPSSVRGEGVPEGRGGPDRRRGPQRARRQAAAPHRRPGATARPGAGRRGARPDPSGGPLVRSLGGAALCAEDPHRVRSMTLLQIDPTSCSRGLRPGDVSRAAPLLAPKGRPDQPRPDLADIRQRRRPRPVRPGRQRGRDVRRSRGAHGRPPAVRRRAAAAGHRRGAW